VGERGWDDWVASHPDGHLLQTDAWAALKSRFGWESEHVAVCAGGDRVAGAHVLFRWLPTNRSWGRLVSIAYVPKGPVVDWRDPARVHEVLAAITAAARRRRALLVRIEPHLVEGEVADLAATLGAAGFRPAPEGIQPRRTIVVDISGTEDEILKQMKPKTRYNLRLAARKGVVVRPGGREDLASLNRLMAVTGARSDFGVHSAAYYEAVYELFAPRGRAALLMAEYEGRPLAALMVFALGETASYLYGASSDEERQRMPAYLLQWEAMRWARAKRCVAYDLWGVPDEDEATLEADLGSRSDGLWGVYRFKRGFGGQLVRWVGAFDQALVPVLYRLFTRLRS
jgi:lipid II:glycine glycyltransferase (peptidoglycan interpeptide bridge formation enzyme)